MAFFLIHPNIIKTIFVSFSCEKIDDDLLLEIDMSQQCWTGDHLMYVLTVSLPSLIIWGIGMPALAIIMLRRYYVANSLFEVRTLSIYGFLYNGYRFSTYYWEIIILYRKCLIVFILVFLGLVSIQVQALVALLIMMVSLGFHMKRLPFDKPNLNMLESQSIIAASITIYCGLYYLSGSLNEALKITFFAIIILVNIFFFVTWLAVFINEFTRNIRGKHEELFEKLFGRCIREKRLLKYKPENNVPARKYTGEKIMKRWAFLSTEFAGVAQYSKDMTDRQFKEMLENKGKMLFSLLNNVVQYDELD